MSRPRIADERGASAVEYGLIVFAVAAVITIALFAFGGSVVGLFGNSCQHISDKSSIPASCG